MRKHGAHRIGGVDGQGGIEYPVEGFALFRTKSLIVLPGGLEEIEPLIAHCFGEATRQGLAQGIPIRFVGECGSVLPIADGSFRHGLDDAGHNHGLFEGGGRPFPCSGVRRQADARPDPVADEGAKGIGPQRPIGRAAVDPDGHGGHWQQIIGWLSYSGVRDKIQLLHRSERLRRQEQGSISWLVVALTAFTGHRFEPSGLVAASEPGCIAATTDPVRPRCKAAGPSRQQGNRHHVESM